MAADLLGTSEAMRRVRRLVQYVAPSDASVLITGETGTGKELVARAIHRGSTRHDQLLVPLNMAAMPLELLESELFGHTRGAFTSAVAERIGKFELAHMGTLFLDEIADAPLALQPKILRVLQDRVIEPLGSNQRREIDVRIISATNQDLEKAVAAGAFRPDLYYRLRVIEIHVPPLRERPDDIRCLTMHFLGRMSEERTGGILKITEEGMRLLEDYPWPGNVRELEGVLERAVVLGHGDTVGRELLDLRPIRRRERPLHLGTALNHLEREMILHALDESARVKTRAARLLGVSERTLRYKLRKHDIS